MSNMEYSFQGSTKEGIKHVATALTFSNPDPYAFLDKIEKFKKQTLTFKIGMMPTLMTYLTENNISYAISDYEYNMPDGAVIDDRMSCKYVHQRNAVEAFFKKRFGIIVVPTRGGKTFIASEILRIFLNADDGNFLFCVDNTTLFTQAVNDIKGFFERYGGVEVGEIRDGLVDTSKRVTVAMIQTIQSTISKRCRDTKKKNGLIKYLKDLKFLCVDEIHDNCSDSKLRIYKRCKKLEYQLCLSATPYRSGAFTQNLKLMEWSGDICYKITEEELRKRKVLTDYKVFLLYVNHNHANIDVDETDYNDCKHKLIYENKFRNEVLKNLVDALKQRDIKTLLLFQSIEHGQLMSRALNETFISGKTKSKEREEAKRKFLDCEGGVLLASNIFKKGVTLPEVRVLINVDDGVEDANTIQKKGRVLGTAEGKDKSLVIDFFDDFESYLCEHSAVRLNTYTESVGETKVNIYDTSHAGWLKDVTDGVDKWFK